MTKNLDNEGLRSIVDNYDLFYIDIWGVVHNGVNIFKDSIKVLNEILKLKKELVLLTNAPRPNENVKKFCEKLGMDKKLSNHIFTSGEAAIKYLKKNSYKDKFFHIGPPRDFDLFIDLKKQKTENIKDCTFFLCTGLFEDYNDNLNYYKDLLKNFISKKMICTNPDLIVDRGNIRELCAGSVAMLFEKIGGNVIYFGKPFPEVYKQSVETSKKRILCIGDNLNTDIKGANLQNYHSLLITNGIHKQEIANDGIKKVSRKYEALVNFMQSELKW